MSAIDAATYSETVTEVLRRNYGPLKHAAKLIAQAVGTTPRTVQNWLDGTNAPRGAELIRLMQECDDLADEIFRIVKEGKCPGSNSHAALSGLVEIPVRLPAIG